MISLAVILSVSSFALSTYAAKKSQSKNLKLQVAAPEISKETVVIPAVLHSPPNIVLNSPRALDVVKHVQVALDIKPLVVSKAPHWDKSARKVIR